MSSELLSVEIAGHIGTVTLHQPTMPPRFFAALAAAAEALNGNDEVRAIVVRSDAKSFSYGLDLKEAFAEHGALFTQGGLGGERERLRKLVHELQRPLILLDESPVPVICAVHGHCLGGGLDLATACDVRLAAKDAQFSLRETKIAMVADLGSLQRLPKIVGAGHTREMAFTGRDVDSVLALRIGLINDSFADREATWAAAHEMATEIAANSPLAVRGAKRVLRYSEEHSVREGLEYVSVWNSAFLASADLSEAITAFMAKRPPSFTGK